MNNLRFATAVHILVLLDKFRGEFITSEFIAGSINVNPVVVRRELKVLRDAGFILSKKGKEGGLSLLKDPTCIHMGELYKLVNQENTLGRMNHPNPACPIGKQMNSKLQSLFYQADNALILTLNKQSLADFAAQIV